MMTSSPLAVNASASGNRGVMCPVWGTQLKATFMNFSDSGILRGSG
jgi:hypothetical protein